MFFEMPQQGVFGNGNYFPKNLSNKDRTILTMIIVVMGKKNFVFPFSYFISPGSLPNHDNKCGANCITSPATTASKPTTIKILPISFPPVP